MNKCFLNHEKNLAQNRIVGFEKNAPFVLEKEGTEPKTRVL